MTWDPRRGAHRAPAMAYASIVRALRRAGLEHVDEARRYAELERGAILARPEPFYYQREAVDAWERAGGRGVVVLPTGSGKTLVATLAIDRRLRSTIVVVPTLDLLRQWHDVLEAAFALPVGLVGGGYYEPTDLTVITYDSAHLHADKIGARFGLVVFDECHHLPSESYATAARSLIAPYRLGLTATPERADGAAPYEALIGPIVYRRDIDELSGSFLASYETHRIEVTLSDAERDAYEAARAEYVAFLRRHGIRMDGAGGWTEFVRRSARGEEGRRAMAAYRAQRRLALTAEAKLAALERLLHAHRADRVIVFTEDNATVYRIARRFLLPAITHRTRVKERSGILRALAAGEVGAVVTSKVLNEGVDVPDANVAVVMSGSGSVREHVQRLGRVLRRREGKRAVLYELVSRGTAEEATSARRREHRAYR
jgi:superfamily II DNA or RNA helicase